MKTLALVFAAVTEAAALVSFRWVGRGNKTEADQAATTAMRDRLNRMNINGTVVIGEGEMDEAPMLHIGEKVGTGSGEEVDIAVDPLEGTNLIVNGQSDSIMGLVPHEVLPMNRLAGSDECIFTATGITDGFLLRGVQSREGALVTHTLLLSGTERKARFLESTHFLH